VTTATVSLANLQSLGRKHHFLLRRLHSLTGIVFGVYVAVHLVVNATIAQGGAIYQKQVDQIHSLPFLIGVEWAFIYLPIIFHALYGSWLILIGLPNNANYPYFKNALYLFQRISGILLGAFIFYHVLSMKGWFGRAFIPQRATATAVANISAHWPVVYLIYPAGILAACFHTANGFWTAGVSWGLTISAGAQRRWGWICLAIFIGMTAAGLTAIIAILAIGRFHQG
jgi:succinate dehydrogenase / fumarate reductase cytochrome b subunit